MATLIALAGVLLIFGVLWVVNSPQPRRIEVQFACDSVSPDGKYRCMDQMAHVGWCHNGDIEWHYQAWAVAADDDTHFAVPPMVPDTATEALTVRRRRIPRPVFWAGLLLVAGVANISYDTSHAQPPEKQWHCEWEATTCTNWQQR